METRPTLSDPLNPCCVSCSCKGIVLMLNTCAIITAAGRGLRMGGNRPKQFLEVSRKPILEHTVTTFARLAFLSDIFLVAPSDYMAEATLIAERIGRTEMHRPSIHVIAGGAERQDSVHNGLKALPRHCEWVMVHDGVRPFASSALIEATWKAAVENGAAIAALPATDTIKRVVDGHVMETLSRSELWMAQTPQVFSKELLMDGFERAGREGWAVTDDASLLERMGVPVVVVMGERSNIKVTTPEDLEWAEWFLGDCPRVGG